MEKKHGGARKGAGRPNKVDEQKVVKLGKDAIKKVYGSIENYFEHIAKESMDSFPHLKLLQEYVFGKPKETVENINYNVEDEELNAKLIKKINDELEDAY